MGLSENYLLKLKRAVENRDYTQEFTILREKVLSEIDEGFIRVRIQLIQRHLK
jgi:hypothetical protein